MFVFDTINTLLAIVVLFNAALLLPLLRNIKNNVQTFVYAVNIVTILLWVITMIGYRSQTVLFDSWLRGLYVAAIFIGVTYMQFALFYPLKIRHAKYYIYATHILAFFSAFLVTLTDTIIVGGVRMQYGEPHIVFGSWYPLYIAIILVPFVIGFARHLYLILKRNTKVMYLLVGYMISANIAFVTNLMLPWFGIFMFNWVGQFFTVVMVSFTTYSILKFNVMNIRFFAVNVGVSFLLIISTAQVLFSDSVKDVLVSSLVLFVSSITGLYLIRLSKQERIALQETTLLNTKIKTINADLEKANERLVSLDKLKSEFISLASHQMRSPLTVIKGYASTLTDGIYGDLTQKQTETVRHMYLAAEGLANVVEDFLNVTKIEQGGMKYVFVPFSFSQMLQNLAADMRIAALDKGLTLIVEDVPKVCIVEGDEVKLRQVFLNIIDNSIKYTEHGFVRIACSLNSEESLLIITISDSGIGMSKETQAKLFTKFGRGDQTTNGGGSGLGLYLAQEIIRAHHGSVSASSLGKDKGSTFTVTLPYISSQ